MPATPGDFLQDLDDPDKANWFIQSALTAVTAEMNRTRVASQVYLAHKTKIAGENLAIAVRSLADALERAFTNHAQALQEAATASEKYARRLVWATWALVGVTGALVLSTFLQLSRGN